MIPSNEFLHTLFANGVSPENRLAIFTLPGQKTRFFDDLDQAAEFADDLCVLHDVYFGVGLISGQPRGRGSFSNIATVSALWADVDCVSPFRNKRLPTKEEVPSLLNAMPQPPSILVDSGYGFHAYWLLQTPVVMLNDEDRRQTQQVTKGWHKLLCEHAANQGWHLENLGDLPRVLRLPGSLNHKVAGQPVPVQILQYDEDRRYKMDDFTPFLSQATLAKTIHTSIVPNPEAQPPSEKLEQALTDEIFRETWERSRGDLMDQSPSGYDMSLATQAAKLGWTDQQIADLILAARRKHGQKPEKALRIDYVQSTIQRAKQAVTQSASDNEILSLKELTERYPKLREPIIHDLLRRGETMNVIAAAKAGKSWLATHLAISIATGQKWLNTFATEPGKVLILDNELHPETTANRIPKVAAAYGVPEEDCSEKIFVKNLRGKLKTIDSIKSLFDQISYQEYQVIILDAFYRFMPANTDENDNGAMANIYNLIDSYADQLGSSFVLIHHSSKGDQSGKSITDVGAGAGSQSRATDTHLILRPHREPCCVVLDAAVRSWAPVAPSCLRWDFPVWQPDDSLDPDDLKSNRPRAKQKDEKLKEPEWTIDRFVELLMTPEPEIKEQILGRAKQQGLSKRKTTEFLRLAESCGLIFRWSFGPTRPIQFATKPQQMDS